MKTIGFGLGVLCILGLSFLGDYLSHNQVPTFYFLGHCILKFICKHIPALSLTFSTDLCIIFSILFEAIIDHHCRNKCHNQQILQLPRPENQIVIISVYQVFLLVVYQLLHCETLHKIWVGTPM